MIAPEVFIIAGPNGSGKSTLTLALPGQGIALPSAYINPDEILREMRQAEPQSDQQELERAAFLKGRELRRTYREQGISFAFETVFSHPSGLLDMKHLCEAGYKITVVVVTTGNPDINVGRVAQRVRMGGHSVDTVKIRDRYQRFMRLLPRIIEEANQAFVFDASDQIRLCYSKDSKDGYVLNVPEYLQVGLVNALEERRQDIHYLGARYESIQEPDEENEICSGVIQVSLPHYKVQNCGQSRFICHDALLLNRIVQEAENVRIVYQQGEGQVTNVEEQKVENGQ